MSDPMLDNLGLSLGEGDVVTDVLLIAVTQNMSAMGQSLYVTATPHTGYITQLGMIEAALDYVKNPTYEYSDEEEDEE